MAAVSVLRQFFFDEPRDLQKYAKLQQRFGDGSCSSIRKAQARLVFRCDELLQAVWSAFTHNRYGDHVAKINGTDYWWDQLLAGPGTISGAANRTPDARHFPPGRLFEP